MLHKISLFIGVVLLFFPSCTKTLPNNGIPFVNVDFNVYLSNPDNIQLQALGNWRYFDGVGSRGIIVYHRDLGL